jgi:hypothetical protein
MLSWLVRGRFTYANVASTFALVFAMSGGALAAKHYLLTSTSQIKPSVLTALKGRSGPHGATGATGAQGPAGPTGPQGTAGAGTAGAAGANGTSVTSGVLPSGNASCKEGGSEFVSASGKTFACNGAKGKEGPAGPEGVCSTSSCVLPAGTTETGVWGTGTPLAKKASTGGTGLAIPISFPIPLANEVKGSNVHIFEGETIPAGCTGEVVEGIVTHLGAESGSFCVYVRFNTELPASGLETFDPEAAEPGTGRSGTLLVNTIIGEEGALAFGTWAVTG